jgi:hypothetical protein
MKKFSEIGVNVIKNLTHKEGDSILKDALYNINEVLYPIQTKYALLELANDALSQLCQIGINVKTLNCCTRYMAKKEEILRMLRKRCTLLREYVRQYNETEQDERFAIEQTMRYLLSTSIRTKNAFINKTIKVDMLLKQLEENKKIHHLLSPKIKSYGINIKQFVKVQEEIIAALSHEYSLIMEE